MNSVNIFVLENKAMADVKVTELKQDGFTDFFDTPTEVSNINIRADSSKCDTTPAISCIDSWIVIAGK